MKKFSEATIKPKIDYQAIADKVVRTMMNSSEGRYADEADGYAYGTAKVASIRYWGDWEVPPGEEDDGDYDWKVPTKRTIKKLEQIIKDEIKANKNKVKISFRVQEKEYIDIIVNKK